MPAGTPVEQTAAVLHALGAHLATRAQVTDYQAYAGTAAPINFNGLVRQYDLRAGGEVGDIQVNLVDKHQRKDQSHAMPARAPGAASHWPAPGRQRESGRSAARPAGARAHRGPRYAPRPKAASRSPRPCARCSTKPPAWSMWTTAASPARRAPCCWSIGARPPCWACRSRPSWARCAPGWRARRPRTCTTRANTPRPPSCNCRPSSTATWPPCCN